MVVFQHEGKQRVPSKTGTWHVHEVHLNGDHTRYVCHHSDVLPSALLTRIALPTAIDGIKRFEAQAEGHDDSDKLIFGGYFMLVDYAHETSVVPALDSMCSLRVTCRLHVHGAGFGVTCRYAHSEYELGWILKDAATGLMIGFVYDGSEYVVGTERILLPAGHDAVADVSQTVEFLAPRRQNHPSDLNTRGSPRAYLLRGYGDTEASKKMAVARESAADYHDDDDWLIGVGTSVWWTLRIAPLVPALASLYNLWSSHRLDYTEL
ncbi:hypothetical protein H257_10857 [Aphanomyces astaci]|uniref:Uncharacterized protein n=1 Tax=Aphanomyces astaci TaxID=112090 RepID=W4G673_APHAT|nr:hypothetical protein H257_10857 [Aphanomyces astaci]ETV74786.1 hypothetical protein H257_10857 [Aphanomyces astaci]|eukprot:XP_009835873.1 hypothetical protein H257_10857 [Aphanomyces astaci]